MLAGTRVLVGITGSHDHRQRALAALASLVGAGADVTVVLSAAAATTVTRFGGPDDLVREVTASSGRPPLTSIVEVEPLAVRRQVDVACIVPCTGNTMAKLALAITDGPVLMAAKGALRNGRPLVLAISTNDALGLNAANLGRLLAARHVFFVPFGQDNPEAKPTSVDAMVEECLTDTVVAALAGRQLQPLLREWHRS